MGTGWNPTQYDLDATKNFLGEYAEWLKENQPYAVESIRALEEAYFHLPGRIDDIFPEGG